MIRMTFMVVALSVSASLFSCSRTGQKASGPPEKVTIALSATTDAVLAEVAQVQGLYRREGLEAILHLHPYGKLALEDVLSGQADFATVAETPVMFAIMKGEKISVIASIESSHRDNAIIARRDRGILTLKDLKGKKVAVTRGTTSDYFLDAILVPKGVAPKEVELADLKAEKIPQALANGDIDAASTFNPYTLQAQKKLGGRGITFQDENIYTWTFNLVATQEFIRKNPERVKKMLRALVRAEEFVSQNGTQAQKILVDFTGIDIEIVRAVWADTTFRVSLDQALILALEDESQWAIANGLTSATKIPNYLDFIYLKGLQEVKPEAVRILR
ncbi:MAG TPA: NrtA/SsuA/CpmA family ABC transporter substrate-binding protein [Thermodesulfovibrionales bacterium]|nr:NrtA/SsuA/CpmA family ABC transporter substrate-binding protein [Thermodesulfovibrionales bacterium]